MNHQNRMYREIDSVREIFYIQSHIPAAYRYASGGKRFSHRMLWKWNAEYRPVINESVKP